MRNIFRSSKQAVDSRSHVPSQDPANSAISEQHPEPMGHVHDYYRHWVWLGLHNGRNQ